MIRRLAWTALIWLVGSSTSAAQRPDATDSARALAEFTRRLDSLRAEARIPAISAAIASSGRIVWSRGFGTADLESGARATDTTVYHLASLTKPFAATLLLQLVEEGKLSLDEPVTTFGISLPDDGGIRVRHLLSHTSGGEPGTRYAYNGNRFGRLDAVIARVSGKPFAELLQERIVARLALRHTAPNPQSPSFRASGLPKDGYERNVARGYTTTSGEAVPTDYPGHFSSAAGLMSSVLDMARFSMALDDGTLLKPATRALAYAPAVTPAGDTLPYALGWFATRHRGTRVVWHYGYWTAISTLIVKVPDRGLTFVLFANTDALSAPYQLGAGRLETSPWARAFLERFVAR